MRAWFGVYFCIPYVIGCYRAGCARRKGIFGRRGGMARLVCDINDADGLGGRCNLGACGGLSRRLLNFRWRVLRPGDGYISVCCFRSAEESRRGGCLREARILQQGVGCRGLVVSQPLHCDITHQEPRHARWMCQKPRSASPYPGQCDNTRFAAKTGLAAGTRHPREGKEEGTGRRDGGAAWGCKCVAINLRAGRRRVASGRCVPSRGYMRYKAECRSPICGSRILEGG